MNPRRMILKKGWSCFTLGGCKSLPHYVVIQLTSSSWEKNLHLLLSAYPQIPTRPKLVFVGDGPARVELEQTCLKEGYDATFMGHRVGSELAECFASADIFAFPSFTEVSFFSTV